MDANAPSRSPIHVVMGEVQSVVAAMRVNSRWSSSARGIVQESPLLLGFKNLRAVLTKTNDLAELDTLSYLKPFLSVIRSEETSGPITGVALTSLHKFLSYGFIHEGSKNASRAMAVIIEIVTHCRFEATAPDSDEVILATILDVLLVCLTCPAGYLLTDELIHEMIQTCFRMSIQKRMSELLRKRAERTLASMVEVVFLTVAAYCRQQSSTSAPAALTLLQSPVISASNSPVSLSPSPSLSSLSNSGMLPIEGEGVIDVSLGGDCVAPLLEPMKEGLLGPDSVSSVSMTDITPSDTGNLPIPHDKGHTNSRGVQFQNQDSAIPSSKPYGVGSLSKIFGFLVGLTQPMRANPESVRHLALTLINSILETLPPPADAHLSLFSAILPTIQNELCRNILMNLTTEDLALFTLTLRVFYNVFAAFKESLKAQVEAFFQCILSTVMDSKSVSYEKQEMALECIVEFCSSPTFMVDLYVNYDCDVHCSNFFETMCKFLYKNAFPVSGSLYTVHTLSLDGLLAVVHAIAHRCHQPPDLRIKSPIGASELAQRKRMKQMLVLAAEHWNTGFKEGLRFLQEMHLVPVPLEPRSIAQFLRNTPGLDKTIVGEYLGRDEPLVLEVLKEYLDTFDFTEQSFVNALRAFLEVFRLPKEAQQISRILEAFAAQYHLCNQGSVHSAEACFVLAFASVLLNVDQHNPNVPEKMRLDQFITNLRGLNGDQDFDVNMLTQVYKSIEENEIKLHEDYVSGKMTTIKWKSVSRKASQVGPFLTTYSNAYDKDIFSIILGCPIIAAISVVFDTASDDLVLFKALQGFSLCASISAHYNLSDVFDNLVISLCNKSTLLSPPGEDPVITFGRNRKAQMATKEVFILTKEYANHFREAWKYILDCILSLFGLDLVPGLRDMHMFVLGAAADAGASPAKRRRNMPQAQSFFDVFFWSADPLEPEPSQEELAAVQQTRETIDNADIRSIFTNSVNLAADSLLYLLKALILADRSIRPKAGNKGGSDSGEEESLLCLDLITAVTILNKERVILVWVLVYEHITSIIAHATRPSRVVEKAVSNLLLLSQHLLASDISDQIMRSLSVLLKLPPALSAHLADLIVNGMTNLVLAHPLQAVSESGLNTVLGIFSMGATYPATSAVGLKGLRALVQTQGLVSAENFFALYNAIQLFATSKKCTSKLAIESMEVMYALFSRLPAIIPPFQSPALSSNVMTDIIDDQDFAFALIPPVSSTQSSTLTDFQAEWEQWWQRALSGFVLLCHDARLDVRHHAMTYLQRALLSPPLQSLPTPIWFHCFNDVLFPFLTTLLEPRGRNGVEAAGLEETRLRASALLSKIFLQYLPKIVHSPAFEDLWLRILRFIELYMKADDSELLAEAVPESLKNILLVMSASGLLVDQPGEEGRMARLWDLSWQRIALFCPDLRDEFQGVLAKQADSPMPLPGDHDPSGDASSLDPPAQSHMP